MSAGARYLFVSATSLFAAGSSSSSANASAGVRWPSTRMGLLSVSSTVSCGSRAMEGATGVRLGGWRRIMPFLFSLPPRRHELYGSAECVAMPGSSRSSACRAWTHAVPAPWLCGTRSPRCPSQSGRPVVPLPTGANTPGPRRNTPPFGYPDNLQSNGCCTFN